MAEFQITCVVRDSHARITHVGIGNEIYEVSTVVNWIRTRQHSFHTFRNGYWAAVYARFHYVHARWFLTTHPDGILEDNLGFLPECQ